jgi:outer membrane protein OmpA-like peptidoglycan-associated protein
VELKSYIHAAQDKMSDVSAATPATVDYASAQNGSKIGDANYHINFATGSAQPLPDGVALLNQLRDSLAVTRAAIEVDGHTDNTGSDLVNQELSMARAQAVEQFLNAAAPDSFPRNRFIVHGYGSQRPVASNATADGKAENRRVEIVLKAN